MLGFNTEPEKTEAATGYVSERLYNKQTEGIEASLRRFVALSVNPCKAAGSCSCNYVRCKQGYVRPLQSIWQEARPYDSPQLQEPRTRWASECRIVVVLAELRHFPAAGNLVGMPRHKHSPLAPRSRGKYAGLRLT